MMDAKNHKFLLNHLEKIFNMFFDIKKHITKDNFEITISLNNNDDLLEFATLFSLYREEKCYIMLDRGVFEKIPFEVECYGIKYKTELKEKLTKD